MVLYKIGSGGLKRIDVPESHEKNNLPVGTVLQLNGYDNPQYVIVENLGSSERFASYGSKYKSVNLSDFGIHFSEAFTLRHISEKKDNRIQLYYTDEILPQDKVYAIYQKARHKADEQKAAKEKAEQIRRTKEARGRELFTKHIPEQAKALIVAELEIDDCDITTDYFNTKTKGLVILGWSKHTKDLFSEMRKFADRIPETAHLKIPATINSNNHPKTEENKSWWHPADEHREKYSMGAGYYLKSTGRYSTGWKIRKAVRYKDNWDSRFYVSIAQRCVFEIKQFNDS